MFKVLWFDDEYKTLEYLHEEAYLNDIILEGYDNAEEGLIFLDKNIELIDAVIIDGIFHLKAGTEGMATKNDAFETVVKRLFQLSDRKSIPCFILSGQLSFSNTSQPFSSLLNNPKIFDKTSTTDRMELWAEIKKQANERIFTQIRTEYPEVFSIFTDKYIGEGYAGLFIAILRQLKEPNSSFNYSFYFSELRKVIEGLFRAFAKYGIVHEACLKNDKVNLAGSSHFLGGNPVHHLNIKRLEPVFPIDIADSVKRIIDLTNSEIHQDRSSTRDNESIIRYQLYSSTFELITVLLWSKDYIDNNQDIERNKSYWCEFKPEEADDWIDVELIEINDKGWGTLKRDDREETINMPPSIIKTNKLKLNQTLQIKTKPNENGKIHVKDLRII